MGSQTRFHGSLARSVCLHGGEQCTFAQALSRLPWNLLPLQSPSWKSRPYILTRFSALPLLTELVGPVS